MTTRALALLAAVGLAAVPAAAQLQPTFPNVTYATVGGRPLQLDIYLPPAGTPSGNGPYPVVVWIHGGGWQGGNRFPIGVATRVLPLGIAVASVSYRLTSQAGQWGAEPVIWPAQIHDVKGAIRFLKANASQYSLDPSRVGSWGSSAGGHLSAVVGTSGGVASIEGTVGGNLAFSSSVIAAADYFGPTDLLNIQLDVTNPPGSSVDYDAPDSAGSRLIGFDQPGQGIGVLRANQNNPNPPYPALIALITSANPITFVDPADPPFYIAHGTSDTVVPLNQSTRLSTALTTAGVANTYLRVTGAGHGNLGVQTDLAVAGFFAQRFGLPGPCYANCDNSTGNPALTPADFVCFLNAYRAGNPYANCDNSTGAPLLTPADFVCYLQRFRIGCG